MSEPITIEPLERPIDAVVRVPGSKSITNRALALAALAEGTSTITGVLVADDTEAMLGALRALGIAFTFDAAERRAVVEGCAGAVPNREATIDARRSGTTARFLLPVLAGFDGSYRLTGSEQLQARPMGALIEAVRSLGADVTEAGGAPPGHLPVTVGGGYQRGTVAVPGDLTSQFLSGLMLAGPFVPGGLRIDVTTDLVSRPYVDMTAALMRRFGAQVVVGARTITVASGSYRAASIEVEPDASSASYFFASAALCGGSVRVDGLTRASVQGDVAFVDVLAAMGAEVVDHPDGIEVRGGGRDLHGISVDMHDLPDMALTVAALAPFADTPTTVTGVGVIRGHESDRIAVIERELAKLGVPVETTPDSFTVHPVEALLPATIETYDDHRVAMAFALIGLRSPGVRVAGPECVAKTFPEFWDVLASLRER